MPATTPTCVCPGDSALQKKSERRKAYYLAHRDAEKAKMKEYQVLNKHQLRAKREEWYKRNKDSCKAYHVAYYEANKDRMLEKQKSYYKQNVEKCLEANRIYYAQNTERITDRNKQWSEQNRESILSKNKERYERNKPTYLARTRAWALTHPDIVRETRRRWYRNHKELAQERTRLNSLRRKLLVHADLNYEVERSLFEEARIKTHSTGVSHHVDHIIPMAAGGWHHHLNLQVLPAQINFVKNDNPLWEMEGYKSWRDVPDFLWPEKLAPIYRQRIMSAA